MNPKVIQRQVASSRMRRMMAAMMRRNTGEKTSRRGVSFS